MAGSGRHAAATDPRAQAIARFAEACAADALVVAAFVGGSFATGSEDEFSDLDLYLVTEDDDYDMFFGRREDFVRSWSDPVFLDTTADFEGFGFDMLHFVLACGVYGELAMGRRSNLFSLHGGPHEVLVDKAALLDGVTFPLYEPASEERLHEIERALRWFWLDAVELAKRLSRGQLHAAQSALARMRERCRLLVSAEGEGRGGTPASRRILTTFVAADANEIATAAAELVSLHRTVGAAVADTLGLDYPARLASVAEGVLHRAAGASG
jgi:nucleotidyltransferase-like protein